MKAPCAALLLAALGTARAEEFPCRTVRPLLGGGFVPNCSSRWTRRIGGEIAFDVDFETDAFGRRVTPGGVSPGRSRNALFFGCSFALGAGVGGRQTTPYYFSEKARDVNVYNYGGSGFGPQQMLVQLSETDIRAQVAKTRQGALGVYLFLDFHVERAVGKPAVFPFGRHFPHYDWDRNGRLARHGTFASARPMLTRLYALGKRVPLLDRLLARWSARLSEGDIRLAARIIEESRDAFLRDFPGGRFIVVFFPGSRPGVNARIKAYLDKAGIVQLDYSSLVDMQAIGARLRDGHPSPEVHRAVGHRLARDLAAGVLGPLRGMGLLRP